MISKILAIVYPLSWVPIGASGVPPRCFLVSHQLAKNQRKLSSTKLWLIFEGHWLLGCLLVSLDNDDYHVEKDVDDDIYNADDDGNDDDHADDHYDDDHHDDHAA